MNFSEAYKIDVSQMTEKKNNLTYLSWANAWKEFKKIFPEAKYEIIKDENGRCWFGDDEHGYVVYTTVTVGELTYEMWLPVMDYRNKSILKPTTFDINKAVMRCLTKNLAMFGLGLYIYAGEDLPEEEKPKDEKSIDETKYNINILCKNCGKPIEKLKKKDGTVLTSKQVSEVTGGLCRNCAKAAQNG